MDEKQQATYWVLADLANLIDRSDLTNQERRGVNAAWWSLLELTDVTVHSESPSGHGRDAGGKRPIGFHP